MSTRIRIAITLASLALVASPAFAGDGKHKGHKHHGDDQVYVIDGHHHDNGKHKGWYKQAWKRGDRIPVAYLEPVYYVEDYRVYHLSAPPVGYRWVRPMDDRYLLVNLASGLVAEALGY